MMNGSHWRGADDPKLCQRSNFLHHLVGTHKTVSKLNCWMQVRSSSRSAIPIWLRQNQIWNTLSTVCSLQQQGRKRKLQQLRNLFNSSQMTKNGVLRTLFVQVPSQFVVHLANCMMTNVWKPSALGLNTTHHTTTHRWLCRNGTLWFPMLQSVSNGMKRQNQLWRPSLKKANETIRERIDQLWNKI